MSDTATITRLMSLPAEERLAIAEAIWQSLAADQGTVPVPDWHREVLAERLHNDDHDLCDGEVWDNFRARIEGSKRPAGG